MVYKENLFLRYFKNTDMYITTLSKKCLSDSLDDHI